MPDRNDDEAPSGTPIPPEERGLISAFAAAVQGPREAEAEFRRLHAAGIDGAALLELLFQLPLFSGYPRTINALQSFRELWGDGIGRAESVEMDPSDLREARRRGRALFERIYADRTARVLRELDRLHAELRDRILIQAYGLVLDREALGPRLRELAAVAALVVSGDLRQLPSHLRGALRCGAEVEEALEAVEIGAARIGEEAAREARKLALRTLEGEGRGPKAGRR